MGVSSVGFRCCCYLASFHGPLLCVFVRIRVLIVVSYWLPKRPSFTHSFYI